MHLIPRSSELGSWDRAFRSINLAKEYGSLVDETKIAGARFSYRDEDASKRDEDGVGLSILRVLKEHMTG